MILFRILAVAGAACGIAAALPAEQNAADPVRDRLVTAKEKFNGDMIRYQLAVKDYFNKREDQARKVGNKKVLDQVLKEREAFDKSGELPAALPAAIGAKARAARKAMAAAYAEAIKEYLKAKQDNLAAAVESDFEKFQKAEGADVVHPFNGKDLKGWKFKGEAKRSKWTVGAASMNKDKPAELSIATRTTSSGTPLDMINAKPGSVDIYTDEKFGSMILELEFMIPKGSNSGVYLMGEYEVQIYDTYGKKGLKVGDMASIYTYAAPSVDACKKPGEWQKFVIDFDAPKFEGGKKIANGKFVKVTFNDQVIHENVELTKGVTPGGLTGKEAATGPLMFQGDHGAVAFRNIKITPKK
jgi:hypothetical protein